MNPQPPPSFPSMPRTRTRLRAHGSSMMGLRKVNEDAFVVEEGLGLLAVADGVGGAPAGELASRCVVDTLREAFEQPLGLMHRAQIGLAMARRRLVELGVGPRAGMATTVVLVAIEGHRAVVAHAGDSRAYRLRGDRLEQLTDDHTLLAELVRHGATGYDPDGIHANTLSRCMSSSLDPQRPPQLRELQVAPGDRFLLCSDGLSGVVPDEDLQRIARWGDPEHACQALLAQARACEAYDDTTVVIGDIGAPGSH